MMETVEMVEMVIKLCFLLALIQSSARADEIMFRWSEGRCQSSSGRFGYNKGQLVECGDLSYAPGKGEERPTVPHDLRSKVLPGLNLKLANADRVNFSHSLLDGANFRSTGLVSSHFVAARAQGALFEGAHLLNAHLEQADLRGSLFMGARARHAHFTGSRLQNANFTHADLTLASFREADLRGAKLAGAIVIAADFRGAQFDEQTALPFSKESALELGMKRVP